MMRYLGIGRSLIIRYNLLLSLIGAILNKYCPKCSSMRVSALSDKAGSGKIRWRCLDCKHRTTNPSLKHPSHQEGMKLNNITSKTLVITSAMANTPTHNETLGVLLNYCNINDAQLIVIPVKYRNQDNLTVMKNEPLHYDENLEKYLLRKNCKVNKNLTIFAERSINATRKKPLVGKENLAKESSGIFAHANMSMEVIATVRDKIPKILHTTGSISLPHYSDSDLGDDARLNHTMGGIVVEVQGDKFFIRQLMVKDGIVYDLDCKYTQTGSESSRPDNISYGDTHQKLITNKEYETIWGRNGLYTQLKPKRQIFNDLFDFYADNHHHANDPLLQFMKSIKGDDCIKTELQGAVKLLEEVSGNGEIVIIPSNHNDHLTQWVNKALKDGIKQTVSYKNLPIMNELSMLATDYIEKHSKYPCVLNLYLEKYCKAKLIFPSRNKEYRPTYCDLSQHGDKGANGARPSRQAFLKTGVPMSHGHSHTPYIVNGFNGVWCAGVSTLNMDYASGLSGWLLAHIIEHPNGQRQMIITIDGKYKKKAA